MGCTNSRKILNDSELDAIIQSTTEKLGLFQYRAEYLDRVIHRNSKNLKISKSQLNKIQETLKLDTSSRIIRAFFILFYSEHRKLYDTRKLATLGILLGQGTYTEKSLLLFQNYDVELKDSLNKVQIKKMISHINYISCYCLPAFSVQFAESDLRQAIEKYKNKICILLKGVTNYFSYLIFDDLPEGDVKFDIISKNIVSQGLNGILDAEMFRRKSLEACKTIQRATVAADYYMVTKNKEFRQRCKSLTQTFGRKRRLQVESGKYIS